VLRQNEKAFLSDGAGTHISIFWVLLAVKATASVDAAKEPTAIHAKDSRELPCVSTRRMAG
jgi:hypothetical protein